MYKRILVPLDGSNFSECILTHVTAIATGCHVPDVVLLRVIEPVAGQVYEVPEEWLKEAREKAKTEAREYLAKLTDNLGKGGIAARSVVIEGNAAEVILDYARKNGVELIMMSTKGQSGVTRWTFGSVTDKIVRMAPTPVMVVAPPGCLVT